MCKMGEATSWPHLKPSNTPCNFSGLASSPDSRARGQCSHKKEDTFFIAFKLCFLFLSVYVTKGPVHMYVFFFNEH